MEITDGSTVVGNGSIACDREGYPELSHSRRETAISPQVSFTSLATRTQHAAAQVGIEDEAGTTWPTASQEKEEPRERDVRGESSVFTRVEFWEGGSGSDVAEPEANAG